jgi:hypothetical protein
VEFHICGLQSMFWTKFPYVWCWYRRYFFMWC